MRIGACWRVGWRYCNHWQHDEVGSAFINCCCTSVLVLVGGAVVGLQSGEIAVGCVLCAPTRWVSCSVAMCFSVCLDAKSERTERVMCS